MNEKTTELAKKTTDTHKMYRTDTLLSVTINPSHQHDTNKLFHNRIDSFATYWSGKLNACPAKQFEFRIEMSKTGRLHYHGYVKVDDPLELGNWIFQIKNNKNIIDIDTISCLKTWKKYIRKDEELFTRYYNNPKYDLIIKYPKQIKNTIKNQIKTL